MRGMETTVDRPRTRAGHRLDGSWITLEDASWALGRTYGSTRALVWDRARRDVDQPWRRVHLERLDGTRLSRARWMIRREVLAALVTERGGDPAVVEDLPGYHSAPIDQDETGFAA